MFSSPETLILQARQQFDTLVALVEGAKNERIDRVEGQIFTELLRLGLTLVRHYVAQHGTGDCGPTLLTETGTWKRLEDLHSRRYVSIFGELSFGRTVYGQEGTSARWGRDHHGRCFSVWLAGGGIRPGLCYGATDDFSYNVTENPVHVHDLNATLLHCLGIDHTRLTFRSQGRDFRLTNVGGSVVQDILA